MSASEGERPRNPMDALADRIETSLKITDGPGMDIRFTMNREAATAYVEQLRTTSALLQDYKRLRAPACADAAGGDWQTVPQEPTPEMLQAGYARYGREDIVASDDWLAAVYRAMAAASPSAAGGWRPKDAEIERLRALLKECADRFERCCRTAGNDAQTAADAVEKYRFLAVVPLAPSHPRPKE